MNFVKKELDTILSKFGVKDIFLPLFYAHRYGIRFELGMEADTHEQYIDDLLVRANTLFGAVFEPDDDIIVALFRSVWIEDKKSKIRPGSYLMRCITGEKLTFFTKRRRTPRLYIYGNDSDNAYRLGLIKCKASQTDHRKILYAFAHKSWSFLSDADWSVVFIHPEKSIMFYMYDDRGLDIVAAEKETLLPLYHNFNNWILDYDRNKIEQSLGINS